MYKQTNPTWTVVAASIAFALSAGFSFAADWPTFRRDCERSGITDENLPLPLVPSWVFSERFAPEPALGPGYPRHTNWEGGVEKRRTDFDRADSTVVAGGKVYFGSVGDGKIYCLDAATGQVQWTFPTGGPVRLAPTIHDQHLYAGSDDGWVYCLSAADGTLKWKFRAAPDDHRVAGSGSLISLWPVRTSVLVYRPTASEPAIAYFGAGFFPSEGVYLYAVDAATGRLIWKNDRGSEPDKGHLSPQGYLLATKEHIVVPMARLAPAIYDRATGKLLRRLSIYYGGGAFCTSRNNLLFTGWEDAHCFLIDRDLPLGHGTTQSLAHFPGGQLVATSEAVYTCALPHGAGGSQAVKAYKWKVPDRIPSDHARRRGEADALPVPVEAWSNPFKNSECLILAGPTLFIGGPDEVVAVNAADGKTLWTEKVNGTVLSLTVAAGRLLASTDGGRIYCFAPKGAPALGATAQPIEANLPVVPLFKQAADTILKLAPEAKKGFALVYGVETGELALELARRTELKIYAIAPDAAKVAAAQKRIDQAGLQGGRVVVQQWPLERVPYTKYFADLVVSETMLVTGKPAGSAAEIQRLSKPIRGKVILGAADGMPVEALKSWLANSPLDSAKIVEDAGTWAVYTRPPLTGARPWTHQYGVPGATGSSEDQLVRAPFRVQWFGAPGPEHMVDRHYWGAAPLAYEGRMFVCSYKDVTAYDVYNGTKLWTYPLVNAVRAHLADVPSNVAVGPDGYFVAVDDVCYRLDPSTGKLLSKYAVPAAADGKRRMWGYVACVDGVLVASRTLGYLPMEKWRKAKRDETPFFLFSDLLFAVDVTTGKVLWETSAAWFRHNSIVIGAGTVFFSDPTAPADQQAAALAETRQALEKFPEKSRGLAQKQLDKPHVELLAALDLKTGQPRWRRAVDWSTCGGPRGALIYKDGLLLQLSDVGGCKAFTGYELSWYLGRCVAVRDAQTGALVWLKPLDYRSRLVVVGDTIYAEPWAYDLKTGERKMTEHPVTGKKTPWMFVRPGKHCGPYNASAHTLFFRSDGFGYYDAERNEGVAQFESNRPSCWMSFISAEGVALWPTGDSGCRCNLAVQCSVALVNDDDSRVFADFTCQGALTPVKHLAVNLGAPGDRRDEAGRLWLAYPRRKFAQSIELPIQTEFHEGGSFERRDATWNRIAGTPRPWLYNSWAAGLKRLQLTVRGPDDGPGTYRVKLAFLATGGEKPGRRVFDVKLQDKIVQAGVDLVKEAGDTDKAVVLTFEGVAVKEDLIVELVTRSDARPLLCGLEVEQVDMR